MERLKRILYVEDDHDISAIAKLTLEAMGGFNVAVCTSGKEALTKVTEFNPQLILLDVMMPEMDGPTTLKKLRDLPQVREVPVVFMTARVQSHQIKEYLDLGAIGIIAKPFDPLTLCSEVEKLWVDHGS